jgi:hypothetical protein
VGLRRIERTLDNPIHETITVRMFVPCLLHCFSRILEKKTQLDVLSVYQAVARGALSKDEKVSRVGKEEKRTRKKGIAKTHSLLPAALLGERYNEIAAGKTEFKETTAGAPERISLNGRKTKQLLSRALNGESLLEGVVLSDGVSLSSLLVDLTTAMKDEYGEKTNKQQTNKKTKKKLIKKTIENYPITDPANVTRVNLSDAVNFHLGWMREFLSADICAQSVSRKQKEKKHHNTNNNNN